MIRKQPRDAVQRHVTVIYSLATKWSILCLSAHHRGISEAPDDVQGIRAELYVRTSAKSIVLLLLHRVKVED